MGWPTAGSLWWRPAEVVLSRLLVGKAPVESRRTLVPPVLFPGDKMHGLGMGEFPPLSLLWAHQFPERFGLIGTWDLCKEQGRVGGI